MSALGFDERCKEMIVHIAGRDGQEMRRRRRDTQLGGSSNMHDIIPGLVSAVPSHEGGGTNGDDRFVFFRYLCQQLLKHRVHNLGKLDWRFQTN